MQFRSMLLTVAMAAVSFAADYSAGVKAYEKGDFTEARNQWEPLAAARQRSRSV